MGSFLAASYASAAGRLPAGLDVALKRDLGISPSQYLADAAASAQAVKVVASLRNVGVDVLGSRMDGTQLTVNIASAADAATVQQADAIAVVGAPALPDFSKTTFTSVTSTATYGGEAYFYQSPGQTGGMGYRCSIGFNGYNGSTGAPEFATAGHCETAIAPGTPAYFLSQTAPAATGANPVLGSPIGTAVAGQYGGGDDYGIISTSGSGFAPQNSIATWGGSVGTGATASISTGAPTASTPLGITGETAGIVGATLCKSGSSSGYTCGLITAVDTPVSVSDETVNAIVATTCLLQGDSGGAAVVGTNAVGIDSGTSSTSATSCTNAVDQFGDPAEYVYFPMVSSAGAYSVAGQQGSNWQLGVAVSSTATVTAPANSATVHPTSVMTGTITGATSSSTALLYLDGSTTPFASANASSGTWSIPLTNVPLGAHTYQLSAGLGWSPGTPVSGTFTMTIAAGSLVKSASSPTIYLVDGSGGLIPVASFGAVTDMGLSTSYSVVPNSAISGITAGSLSNLVSCAGTTYLAAAGHLASVPSSVYGSLPVEALASTLCAVIPRASSALVAPVFIKDSGSTIYQFVGGQIDPVASYSQMVALSGSSSPTWLTVNDSYLGSVPVGPTLVTTGSLVKSASSPTLYLVDGSGGLIPVATFGTITDMGLSTSYSTVSSSTITGVAASSLSNLVSCSGTAYLATGGQLAPIPSTAYGALPVESLAPTLCAVIPKTSTALTLPVFIKGSASTIYQLLNGKLVPMTSYSQMQALDGGAGSTPTWVIVNDAYLGSVPLAPTVVPAGALVKSSAAPTIYLADGNGGLIPVATFGTITDMGLSTSFSVVSTATIASLTIATSQLQNLVKCGSTNYLAAQGTLNPVASGTIASLPVESLANTLCAVVPTSSTALPTPLFIKGSASTIYEFSGGSKTPMATYAQMLAANNQVPPTWVTINDVYVASIPAAS